MKKRIIAILILLWMIVLVSCALQEATKEYEFITVKPDYTHVFDPLFASRPEPPALVEDIETLSDVMYNSTQFQVAYYSMCDYADSLERAINSLLSDPYL